MEITSESLTKVFRAFMLIMMVIVNNYFKEELGSNQPRNVPEPGWPIESFERIGKPVETKCSFTLVYEGKWPEPCPIEGYASYRLYRDWKRRNGLKNRAAREHLGYYEDPMPMEVIYEGKLLNVQEALESNRIKQLELMVAMDSVLSTRPGRSNGVSELHAKRARQELKQLREMQSEP